MVDNLIGFIKRHKYVSREHQNMGNKTSPTLA